MRFGKIDFDPARNPAVLDTGTWDEGNASRLVLSIDQPYWQSVLEAFATKGPLPAIEALTLYRGSAARSLDSLYVLAGLADGQYVLLEIGFAARESALGTPLAGRSFADQVIRTYRTDACTLDRYCQLVMPEKGPKALGAVPRLGIGVRMTTALWPAVYRAMDRGGFAANAIQNSMRELELLDHISQARPPETIYYPGFGTVESGHTGSTFEGLWVYGVLEALKSEGRFQYGADADHIKVVRGTDGMARAQRVLDAARHYTFYTLDVSDVLDYEALMADSPSAAAAYLSKRICRAGERSAVLTYHTQAQRIGGMDYRLDAATLGRLVGKYWDALQALGELAAYIRRLKGDRPYDLEFAVDERPPEVTTCSCISTDVEAAFVLLELRRRQLPVTHVALNFGVEKGVDYRCPDGLAGLEARVRSQYRMANECGVLLDFHSGDDLSSATRRVIGRATEGRNHFKISPEPQFIFAETVRDMCPELFKDWWEDAMAYARREAAAGSTFAAQCIAAYLAVGEGAPSPRDSIFHNYGFAYVGRRGADGQYLHRERLYGLSSAFYREYQNRVESYLCRLAQDLLAQGGG